MSNSRESLWGCWHQLISGELKKWISKKHETAQVGRDFKRAFSPVLCGKWSLDEIIKHFVNLCLENLQWLLRSMKPSCLLLSLCGSLWMKSSYPLCTPFEICWKSVFVDCIPLGKCKNSWMQKERRWKRFSTDTISTRIMRLSGRPEYRTLLLWEWICASSP